MNGIRVREGTIDETVELSQTIPEFPQPYGSSVYEERLSGKPHLILIAEVDGDPAGFKVGYQKETADVFYSWMGGVLTPYRRMGLATLLADAQEVWAREQGYTKLCFKTRNRLKGMLHFGIGRGFMITGVIKMSEMAEYRVVMEKMI